MSLFQKVRLLPTLTMIPSIGTIPVVDDTLFVRHRFLGGQRQRYLCLGSSVAILGQHKPRFRGQEFIISRTTRRKHMLMMSTAFLLQNLESNGTSTYYDMCVCI